MAAEKTLANLAPSDSSTADVSAIKKGCYEAINDDLNTPVAIARLFEAVKIINLAGDGKEQLTAADIDSLKALYRDMVHDILGLTAEEDSSNDKLAGVITLLLDMRQEAKEKKEWEVSDRIRNRLSELGITVKDRKDGYDWEISH